MSGLDPVLALNREAQCAETLWLYFQDPWHDARQAGQRFVAEYYWAQSNFVLDNVRRHESRMLMTTPQSLAGLALQATWLAEKCEMEAGFEGGPEIVARRIANFLKDMADQQA